MKLQIRVFVMSFLVIMIFGVLILLTVFEFNNRLVNEEINKDALSELKTCISILERENMHLQKITRDYAYWDDTYDFVKKTSQNYISSNTNKSVLENLDLEVMAFFDRKGDIIYDKTIGSSSKNPAVNEMIKKFGRSYKNGKGDFSSGLMDVGGINYMYSTQHIKNSQGAGKSNGILLLARPVDEYLESKLDMTLGISPKIIDITSLDADKKKYFQSLFKSNILESKDVKPTNYGFAYDQTNKEFLNGYYLINDYMNQPIALLKATVSRKTAVETARMGTYISIIVMASCVATSIILGFIIKKIIVNPIVVLTDEMTTFSKTKKWSNDESLGIFSKRNDEVGSLTRQFFEMGYSVVSSHEELQKFNDTLEDKIMLRTYELENANRSLVLSETVIIETNEGILICDSDSNIIRTNHAFCSISGYYEDELLGNNPRILKSNRHDSEFYTEMWDSIVKTGKWSGEIWNRKKSGEVYPVWLSINSIKDNDGVVLNYISIISDISKLKDAEAQLSRMAFYDSLTGLPNRALFYDRLSQAIRESARYDTRLAVLFMDLDGFKHVNDTWGHNIGDILLIEASERIKKCLRSSDTIARLGGDEFTVILKRVENTDYINSIAEKIINSFKAPFKIENSDVSVGVSIGISLVPDDDGTVEGIVRKADAAMYESKSKGKGCLTYSSDEIDKSNKEKVMMLSKLMGAMEKREFVLHYQLQVNVENGIKSICGMEALIRWYSEDGIIPPDKFIPLAEESGIIIPMGKWVIEEAARTISILEKSGLDIPISINVSVKQINEGFVDEVKDIIKENAINPKNLHIEVTESLFINDESNVIGILEELRAMGIKIYLDDFGTGYSSLSMLKRMPIDFLKIDKSFIHAHGDRSSDEIVSAIISVAKILEIDTISEGVETLEQMNFLLKSGGNKFQGYLFAKPMKFEDVLDKINNWVGL